MDLVFAYQHYITELLSFDFFYKYMEMRKIYIKKSTDNF